MNTKNSKQNIGKEKQISIRLSQDDYDRLIKAVGPYVKIAAIVRAQVLKFIDQETNKQKAA